MPCGHAPERPIVASERDPDRLLARAGVRGDPRQDQHFLIDDRVLDRIVDYADALAVDLETILEIGPGTGALTDRLLTIAETVVAVERDRSLVTFLEREFATEIADDRLTVLAGDALEIDVPRFDALVANLPYGVSSPIIFRYLPFERPMVVMVQREFADRLVAEVGTAEYGRLTVTVGHRSQVRILEVVPPTAFQPQPPVDSAIVEVRPTDPAYTVADEAAFLDLVTGIFTQRRKTLRNALRNTTHLTGIESVDAVIEALPDGWADRRPATISPDEFATIAAIVEETA